FDFNFEKLVTIKVMKLIYFLAVLGIGLGSVLFLAGGLRTGGGAAFVALIVAPLGFILGTVMIRIYLEVVVVLFRILENVKGINLSVTGTSTPAPGSQGRDLPPDTQPGPATS